MTLDEFVQYLFSAIFILIFVVSLARAIRQPLRANVDIALLSGVLAWIVGQGLLGSFGIIQPGPIPNFISTSLLLVMMYLLLRLVSDFKYVPRRIMLSAEVALGLLIIALLYYVFVPPRPQWLTLPLLAYVLALLTYTTVSIIQEARSASGVTKRRMRSVAVGSFSLLALFILAGLQLILPGLSVTSRAVVDLFGLAAAVGYYLGFATPGILRRAWQEPELRAFLGRAAVLPRLPDTMAIVQEIQLGTARSLGAPLARVVMVDEPRQVLIYELDGEQREVPLSDKTPSGEAYLAQRAVFRSELEPGHPYYNDPRLGITVRAAMAAPITAGEKRLGSLAVYAERPPIFAEEDLSLLQLLADQAAVVLESRALIDEAARVQAREQVTRLKEDFLSAAAHDLKTPLTILIAQTELLERRALRAPAAPADINGLQRLKREAYRLKALVLEFLDAAMAEQGRLLGIRGTVDLATQAREVCSRHDSEMHPCQVEATEIAVGIYDPNRIQQLIENLVENAVKYSPAGGPITIRLWREEGWNHLTVSDRGIGIPEKDKPNVFERFHRGTNVDDRHFAGMGLGLYICQSIVTQHGGRIWIENNQASFDDGGVARIDSAIGNNGSLGEAGGPGSTFHVVLPAAAPANLEPNPADAVTGAASA